MFWSGVVYSVYSVVANFFDRFVKAHKGRTRASINAVWNSPQLLDLASQSSPCCGYPCFYLMFFSNNFVFHSLIYAWKPHSLQRSHLPVCCLTAKSAVFPMIVHEGITLHFLAAPLWNRLPLFLQCLKIIDSFKKQVNTFSLHVLFLKIL